MEKTISLNGKGVVYTLERKRVKNVNLRVRGGALFVSAPRWVPLALIESFLRERADFILAALERTEPVPFPPCAEGSSLPYLGRYLTLRLAYAPQSAVLREGGELRVCLRRPEDGESVRRALDKWYRAESEALCRSSLDRLWAQFASLGVPRPEIRMRAMRSCWGNCRPAKRIVTFNARLAAVPEEEIDYVVAHELTHFLRADHSPAFYSALARVIPDWKARRRALRSWAALLND